MNVYQIGIAYEWRAARYVKKRGYRVLEKRFRAAGGEVDLICSDGNVIVFLEVKARPESRLGSGIAAVNADKRRRLRAAAGVYLRQNKLFDRPCRFDIIEFTRAGVVYMENAF